MHIFLGYLFAFLTAGLVIVGDYYVKLAADAGRSLVSVNFFLGAMFYVGSTTMWFFSLRQIGLAQAGVAFSMLTLLAICAMGTYLFGEKLYARELLGIAFALVEMVLMVRVT